MSAHVAVVAVRTEARLALVDVSGPLARAVRESGVATGIAHVFVPHATCALVLNEDEAGLRSDLLRLAGETVEPLRRRAPFEHDRIDDNAAAHLTAVMLGASITVPIERGQPVLGPWQTPFLVELDGPRTRTLRVTVLGG